MRIYILSNAAVKKNILAKLEPYLHNSRYINYIWSVNGLLQIENDKIYKIKIKDVISKKTLLGAYPVTIDESEFIREEECYQIAPRSHKEYMTIKTYKLATNASSTASASANLLTASSDLEWIFEYKDDELHDNYFSLANGEFEDIHSPKVKADLLKFLNL
jgi:hypothetical protein